MQPCPTCGGMGIDANGYCTQCQTYRGLPQTPSSGVPYSDAPYSGAPYGQSPASPPYGGYPTSGPGYGQPTSGPGYPQPTGYPQPQPTSGGAPMAYPAATYGGAYGAPPAPPKKRSGFMVPLLALSGVLVLLVVAIVVVVLVKNGGDNSGGGGTANPTAGTGSATPEKSLVDQCVVGTWEMTSYTEDVPVDGVGNVPFKLDGKGAVLTFSKDGKGVQDFGDGTNFTGTVSGANVNLKITGPLKYDFRTNDGVMSYSNLTSQAKYTISSAATQLPEETLPGSTDPSKYNCNGSTMTMSTSSYNTELHKTSDTVSN